MNRYLYNTSKLNLEFLTGSYVKLDSNWKTPLHRCTNTRLYYVYKGEAILYHNGNAIPMKPGYLYLIPANLEVRYTCPEYMEKLFFHVAITNLENFDILSNIPIVCQLPCSQELLTKLKKLHMSTNIYDLLQLKILVSKTIGDCLELADLPPMQIKSFSAEILKVISYLQNNTSIQLTAEQIAQDLFISRRRLQKHFKTETGLTIGEYLDRLLVYRATQLMVDPQLSLREISEQLGFCDQFYFSRRFKKLTGQTPSEFRKTLK
jgi:YesN/AraC family two-component response regulator